MRYRKKCNQALSFVCYICIKNNVSYNVHNTLVCTISFSSHNKAGGNLSLFQFVVPACKHDYLLKSILFLVIKKHKKANTFLGIIYF